MRQRRRAFGGILTCRLGQIHLAPGIDSSPMDSLENLMRAKENRPGYARRNYRLIQRHHGVAEFVLVLLVAYAEVKSGDPLNVALTFKQPPPLAFWPIRPAVRAAHQSGGRTTPSRKHPLCQSRWPPADRRFPP